MKSLISMTGIGLFLFVLILPDLGCNKANSATSSYGVEAAEITPSGLTWYHLDDLEKMNLPGDKKVLVDVYTNWCTWCKVMDRKTFTNPEIISYLNENLILVKFNAEQREPITFNGKTYEWKKMGRRGLNTLTLDLLNGRPGYPTIVYLDSNLNKIKVSPGYKTPEQLMTDLIGLN